MTGTRRNVALRDRHPTSFILTCRAAELLPSGAAVLSAPQEDRVLFEVAVVDRRRAHLAGAVGAGVERGEGSVHVVEQLLGRPKESAMLVRGGQMEVLGSGTVTVLDAHGATLGDASEAAVDQPVLLGPIALWVLPEGSSFDFVRRVAAHKGSSTGQA
jgi:hypothetical protein